MRLRPWPSAWRPGEEVQGAAEACQGEEEGPGSSSFDSPFWLELEQTQFIRRRFSSKYTITERNKMIEVRKHALKVPMSNKIIP